MSKVYISVSSPYINSTRRYDTGYTVEEWPNVCDDEKTEIITDAVFRYAEYSVVDEDGKPIEEEFTSDW